MRGLPSSFRPIPISYLMGEVLVEAVGVERAGVKAKSTSDLPAWAGAPSTSGLSMLGLPCSFCSAAGAGMSGNPTSVESDEARSLPESSIAGSGTATGWEETGATKPAGHDGIGAAAESSSFAGADIFGAFPVPRFLAFAAGMTARGGRSMAPRARVWGFKTAWWIRLANSPVLGTGWRFVPGSSWEGAWRERIGVPTVEVMASAPFSAVGW